MTAENVAVCVFSTITIVCSLASIRIARKGYLWRDRWWF